MMSPAAPKPLPREPDPAILELARAIARQLAREDHARATGQESQEPARTED